MENNRIQQGLEQDAQVIRERIPDVITKESIEDTAYTLRAFIKENDVSQQKVAELLGVSRAVINSFLNKGYKGNNRRIVNKIINLINSLERKSRHKGRFVDTTVAKRINMLITQTEAFSIDEGKAGLIVGDAGHGKSICLRQYAQANKNTIYVELDGTMGTRNIFAELARRLKLNPRGTIVAISQRIIEHLKCRNLVVIMDEASGLKVKQLNLLRQIIMVKGRCPLILGGNVLLLKTVMLNKSKCSQESLEQFTSRLIGILNLDEIASDMGGGLYTAQDIRTLYEYGGIRLTNDAVRMLQGICRTPRTGRLRTCSNVIAALHTAGMIREKGYIDAGIIALAIEQLDLPVKAQLPLFSSMAGPENEKTVAAVG